LSKPKSNIRSDEARRIALKYRETAGVLAHPSRALDKQPGRKFMRQYFMLGLGMFAGAAIGAGAVTALRAQAKPPAYFVVEIDKVNDAEGFKVITQRPRGGADVAKELGGHYIARTDKITALDGTAPQRFIAYQFDSVEKAQAFNNSSYMTEVNAIRDKTTQARSFIVEGMPQ
jgi:uncharacterized protein (DUF1330 family)